MKHGGLEEGRSMIAGNRPWRKRSVLRPPSSAWHLVEKDARLPTLMRHDRGSCRTTSTIGVSPDD
jgi:hypothetical protein